MHLCVDEMSRKYGDIISYWAGAQLIVAVCSYDLVKELLDDDNYAARPNLPFVRRLIQGCGILFGEGESWTRQRRLALKSLRDFGFARTRSIEMVDSQLDIILQLLERTADANEGIRVSDAFTEATNGVIAQLTLNRRFQKGEPEFDFVNKSVREFFNTPLLLAMPLMFPYLDLIVRMLPSSNSFIGLMLKFHDFIREQIRIREAILVDESMEPECLCDVYIREKRKAEAQGDFESYKELQIIRVILEFFLGGTDTTARSLEWLFILMSMHPDIQTKVQSELDHQVGSDRRTQMSDRPKLHFTSAVIEEGFRFVSLAALGIFHRAKKDAVFQGYRIPKDTMILPCVYTIHRDPRIWAKPNEFYPGHFLDQNGAFTGPGKSVPFLIGRRSCAGEGLARMEVFLMFTAIMQRFKVSLDPKFAGKEAEILKGSLGLVRQPGEHRLIFQRR